MAKTLREMYAMIGKELEKQPSKPREEIFLEVLNKCRIPDDRENRRITYLIRFREEFPEPIREGSIKQETEEQKTHKEATELSLTDEFIGGILDGSISKRDLEKDPKFGKRLKGESERRKLSDFPFRFR